MFMKFAIISLLFAASSNARPLSSRNFQTERVTWGPCTFNGTLPIQCGTLTVPLDYSDPSSNVTIDLELVKVLAPNKTSKGSILFNFGGPGLGVREDLASAANILQAITGGGHDLIGWDPRGTVNTFTFSCYANSTDRVISQLLTISGGTANRSDPMALGRSWTAGTISANNCYSYPDSKAKGELIGTAFTARDMMQIVDALEDDGLLRYWGFSYGTVLGATVAAMFPDRMDKIVLDGVLNPHEYYNSYDVEMWSDTDKVFSGFLESCTNSPGKCDLAHGNTTSHDLEAAIYNFIYTLKYHPIPWQGTFLDHSLVKSFIRPALYSPSHWPALATTLDALLAGDLDKFTIAYAALEARFIDIFTSSGTGDDSAVGIQCADKAARADSLDEMLPVVDAFSTRSRILGDYIIPFHLICAQWKMQSKGRYQGDFQGVQTKNPILLIGNTFDPATPFRSAQNVSAGFKNSVLLQHNGYGHASLAQPSLCTAKSIKGYFMDGVLPEKGTICEPAFLPFSNGTIEDILPQLD